MDRNIYIIRKSSFARSSLGSDDESNDEQAQSDEQIPVPRSRPTGRMASRRSLHASLDPEIEVSSEAKQTENEDASEAKEPEIEGSNQEKRPPPTDFVQALYDPPPRFQASRPIPRDIFQASKPTPWESGRVPASPEALATPLGTVTHPPGTFPTRQDPTTGQESEAVSSNDGMTANVQGVRRAPMAPLERGIRHDDPSAQKIAANDTRNSNPQGGNTNKIDPAAQKTANDASANKIVPSAAIRQNQRHRHGLRQNRPRTAPNRRRHPPTRFGAGNRILEQDQLNAMGEGGPTPNPTRLDPTSNVRRPDSILLPGQQGDLVVATLVEDQTVQIAAPVQIATVQTAAPVRARGCMPFRCLLGSHDSELQVQALQDKVSSVEADKRRVALALTSTRRLVADLEDEKAQLSEELTELEEDKFNLESELAELRSELETSVEASKKAEVELASLRPNAGLGIVLATTQAELAETKIELSKKVKDITNLEKELESTKSAQVASNEAAEKERTTSTEAATSSPQLRIELLKGLLSATQDELADTRVELQKVREQARLQKELDSTKLAAMSKEAAVPLRSDMPEASALSKEIENLKAQLESLKEAAHKNELHAMKRLFSEVMLEHRNLWDSTSLTAMSRESSGHSQHFEGAEMDGINSNSNVSPVGQKSRPSTYERGGNNDAGWVADNNEQVEDESLCDASAISPLRMPRSPSPQSKRSTRAESVSEQRLVCIEKELTSLKATMASSDLNASSNTERPIARNDDSDSVTRANLSLLLSTSPAIRKTSDTRSERRRRAVDP